jgi:hypothetical protein
MKVLLCDHAAGYAISGVAGRIGLVVVTFGVDDDRSAAVAEKRVSAFAESYVFVFHFQIGFAFGVYGEVVHVAGVMAFGILQAVLLGFGIEMRASRFEVGNIALGVLMKVDGVLARRKIMKAQLESDTRPLRPKADRANGFALGVLEFDFGLGGAGESGDGQNRGKGDERKSKVFHAGDYS